MLARVALLHGLVSCSGAPPAARVGPLPPPAPLPATADAAIASRPPKVEPPAAAKPAAAAHTALVLSDERARNVIVRFDSGACTSNEGTQLELELRGDEAGVDAFTLMTDNAPAACNEHGRRVESGDYNLDGHEDLAVPVDNAGQYGGPTFAILLYQPLNGHYVEARLLSALTRESLGLFKVDARRKRLIVYNKSGCCLHHQSELTVSGDFPVVVSSQLESIVYKNDTCQVVLERTLANGKNQTTTRSCAKDEQR